MLNWGKVAAIRLILLTLLGFGAISWGVYLIFRPAGLIAAGVSLLLLAYLTDPTPPAVTR